MEQINCIAIPFRLALASHGRHAEGHARQPLPTGVINA